MSAKNALKLLSALTDDELLVRLSDASKHSRCSEAVLVAHIAEVDARRLYAREASPTMFSYCTEVLHLSEAEAYRRIGAGRLSRRFPLVLTMLEDGRMHLCGIAVLSKHLTEANYESVLAQATHKTKRELEELAAELAPKQDVPPTIRKVPQPRALSSPSKSSGDQCVETAPRREVTAPPAAPEKRPTVAPLSPARYKVAFTASAELRDRLKRLEALIPGSDVASIIDAAVSEKLERLEAKRFGKTNHPRKSIEDADTSPGVRGISAAVKRFVWERDGGQCRFVNDDGKRCPERNRIEYHHDDPYGRGGDRSANNIRLMCKCHNLYMAELDFGKEKMDAYRRSADRVGEPMPSFELCPDTVPSRSQGDFTTQPSADLHVYEVGEQGENVPEPGTTETRFESDFFRGATPRSGIRVRYDVSPTTGSGNIIMPPKVCSRRIMH